MADVAQAHVVDHRHGAEAGGVAYTEALLYSYRLSPGAISGAHRRHQKAFGRLGQRCRAARQAGRSEDPVLAEAQVLSDRIRSGNRRPRAGDMALSLYHIGCLLARTDPAAAAGYFRKAVAADPWCWRARLKILFPGSRR